MVCVLLECHAVMPVQCEVARISRHDLSRLYELKSEALNNQYGAYAQEIFSF